MVSRSPAWAPQAMLTDVTEESTAISADFPSAVEASPTSAFRSMRTEVSPRLAEVWRKKEKGTAKSRCPFASDPAPQHNHGALAVISDR